METSLKKGVSIRFLSASLGSLLVLATACKVRAPDTELASSKKNCRVNSSYVTQLSKCIDGADKSPRQCLSQLAAGRARCDIDGDGLDDNFEDALARSYSLAFAFNAKDRPESCWPGSVKAFVKNSLLLYSPGGVSANLPASMSGYKVVEESPTLADIGSTTYKFKGVDYPTSNPQQSFGSNFWLCQRKAFDPLTYDGPLGPTEKLATAELAAALPGGIETYAVVHPAGSNDSEARYVFVATELFYPYNEMVADDHEGDWEGGGVLVDTEDPHGAVLGAYYDRHPTKDRLQLTLLGGDVVAIDAALDTDTAYQCADAGKGVAGLRFWDYATARHHVVLYPASGGHASYGYPGTTQILGSGCQKESYEVHDSHHGDGMKLLPWLSAFVPQWGDTAGLTISDGVEIANIGEAAKPRYPWAHYRGQWGCQDGVEGQVGASWPGPFGNHRHCRAWLRHNCNDAPPFSPPNSAIDCADL